MNQQKQPRQRLSSLLIQELCDGDHNCPFRRATPVFMCEAWYAASQKPEEEIEAHKK